MRTRSMPLLVLLLTLPGAPRAHAGDLEDVLEAAPTDDREGLRDLAAKRVICP